MNSPSPLLRGRYRYVLASLLLILLITPQLTDAQTFVRSYGTSGIDESGTCLLPIGSDTLVVGGTRGDSTLLLFMDANGVVFRERVFKMTSNASSDILRSIIQDSDGRICGVGRNITANEGYVFRYDIAADAINWISELSAGNIALDLVQSNSNELTVFGQSLNGTTGVDGLATHVALNTGAVSNLNYYEIGSAETFAVGLQNGSNFVTTGRFNLAGGGTNRMRSSISQLGPGLGLLGSQSYLRGPNQDARLYSDDLIQSNPNEYIMASHGDPNGTDPTLAIIYLSAHDLGTNLTWGFGYDFPTRQGENATEVVVADQSLVTLGHFTQNNNEMFLMGTDLGGNFLWAESYPDFISRSQGGNGQMIFWNGFIYMTGTTPTFTGEPDLVVMRTTVNGRLESDCPTTALVPNVAVYDTNYNITLTQTAPPLLYKQLAPNQNAPDLVDSTWCGSEPCQAATDPNFTTFNPGSTLTGYNSLDGKIYIPDNVIVNVSGSNSVLDLTVVDIVFGQCAGIRLDNGASLRANNSVFRPCDPAGTWAGISFVGAGLSEVNECTFKNAQIALDFTGIGGSAGGVGTIDCSITGNAFLNNRIAIQSRDIEMRRGITGNIFSIDDKSIDFTAGSCGDATYSGEHSGIYGISTNFSGSISHNDFANAGGVSTSKNLTGIYGNRCNGTAVDNDFVNNFRGIEFARCNNFSIEDNDFSVSNDFRTVENQIRVSGNSSYILIAGNDLKNTNETSAFSTSESAIYFTSSSLVNVKENIIDGFSIGVYAHSASSCQISMNQLSNQNIYGILMEDGQKSDINCNVLDLRARDNTIVVGIGYLNSNPDIGEVRINSNCIYNTHTALLTFTSVGGALPRIENNFLYNYIEFGLRNVDCMGDLGTSTTSAATSGRNSFYSNNAVTPGNFDISSTVVLPTVGNTGIVNTTGPVTVSGLGAYSSTTSCGSLPGTADSEYLMADYCDVFSDDTDDQFKLFQAGDFTVLGAGDLVNSDRWYTSSMGWIRYALQAGESTLAAQIYDYSLNLPTADAGLRSRLTYTYQLLTNQPVDIAGVSDDGRWGSLTRLEDIERSGSLPSFDQAGRLAQLVEIDGNLGDQARDLRRIWVEHTPYRHRDIFLPPASEKLDAMAVQEEQLHLFPNPGSGVVSLKYALGESGSGEVQVYNTAGQRVFRADLDFEAGTQSFDWSELTDGIYLVSISREGELVQTGRWIKF